MAHNRRGGDAPVAPTPGRTDEARGETARLLQAITPLVEATRRALFRGTAPPFTSLTDASTWIRNVARRQRPVETARVGQAYARAVRACGAFGKILGCDQPTAFIRRPVLSYRVSGEASVPGQPSRDYKSVPVSPTSPLGQLKRVVAAIADVTGFEEEAVVAYILVGREPFLSPFTARIEPRSVRLPSGVLFRRPSIEFRLHVHDIPWSQLRDLYGGIRRTVRLTHRAMALTVKEDALRKVLASQGGVPARRGAGEAWNTIARRAGYPNGQAARVAYNRIRSKADKAKG